MPASARSLRISDAYRQRLILLRERAALLGRWTVRTTDIDQTGAAWLERTVPQLEVLQQAGVTLTAGYLAAFIAAETGQPLEPVQVDDEPVGQAQDGQPLAAALAASLITVKAALKDGRAEREALALGEQRAKRLVSDAATAAPRAALHAAIETHPQIVAWRRVTQGASSCGACLASADGRARTPSERLHIHPFCDCTAEPVLDGIKETARRPTGREVFDGLTIDLQDALLGKEKASLVRTGQVPFERLIQPQPMVIAPDGITERPLAALTQ